MIFPVILCGGTGSRLWPLSRKSMPKQFASIDDDSTLFQDVVKRTSSEMFNKPLIVTSTEYRFIVAQQLHQQNIEPLSIILEPSPRNTAPSVLAAAQFLTQIEPSAMMLVMPSDHSIPDKESFCRAIKEGKKKPRQVLLSHSA